MWLQWLIPLYASVSSCRRSGLSYLSHRASRGIHKTKDMKGSAYNLTQPVINVCAVITCPPQSCFVPQLYQYNWYTTVIPVIPIKILSYGLKICNKHLLQVPGYHVGWETKHCYFCLLKFLRSFTVGEELPPMVTKLGPRSPTEWVQILTVPLASSTSNELLDPFASVPTSVKWGH